LGPFAAFSAGLACQFKTLLTTGAERAPFGGFQAPGFTLFSPFAVQIGDQERTQKIDTQGSAL
jgi:hypothetical protein